MKFDMVDNTALGTVIKVVGVGGAGGNAVQHMINKGMSGVEFIAANTDAQALSTSKAHNIIQIGDTGLGAGMKPAVGRQLAEESRTRIADSLRGAHMVFIAAGMGGGTGTGAAPIVAEVAKEMGALTVAVVSKPFSYEGQKCMDIADEGLEQLSLHVDSLIIILNEKLEEIYEDESMLEWMQHADDVLNNAVAGIAEIINVPGHINVDFNDVKTIMGEQGKAMMGTATASGVDRARIAAGMGGGTGTGAAPIVAEVAKELGALTVAVVSKPFSYEGQKCMDIADEGLEQLSLHVDSLIIMLNEKREEIYEDESMLEWMQHADDVLNNAVAGIAEIINVPGHLNVDFNDVKTIMGEQGKAMMGTATASGVDRARIAAEQAVASPLLDGIDLSGARGVLVNVTASRGLKGKEIKEVMAAVRAFAAPDASIAQGIAYDDEMGDDIRVTVVATGLGRAKKNIQLVPQQVLRTGTHNSPLTPSAAMGSAQAATTTVGVATPAAGFDGMKAPAVWRRESASEQVRAMEKNGMETYDIPAFLRKQAD